MAERLVLYDSYFGNTAVVAKVVGEAIGAVVKKVDNIQPEDFEGLRIFFIGSPTRAFRPTQKVQFLLQMQKGKLTGVKGSVFDTRIPVEKTNSGPPEVFDPDLRLCGSQNSQSIQKDRRDLGIGTGRI